MNAFVLKVLSWFPQVAKAFAILKWLLAETGWGKDVALWLAAENQWYFQLAAALWGEIYVADPNALKPVLLAQTERPPVKSSSSRGRHEKGNR